MLMRSCEPFGHVQAFVDMRLTAELSDGACSFGGVPITALTATATDACRDDVIKVLRMGSPQVFQASHLGLWSCVKW